MQIITNQTEWQHALTQLPHNHVLQSWPWGEVKSRWSWQPTRLLWRDGDTVIGASDTIVGAAQVLRRAVPYTPWSILYVSKGPLFDYRDISLAGRILTDLEQYAAQQGALFIKIDPDVSLGWGEQNEPDMFGQIFRELLVKRGWCFSPEQIQFRNTMLIDLSQSEEALLAAMKSKWRYNIRLAGRKGVTIEHGTMADIPQFYHMYAETAARDEFLIRPEAYYRDVWETFMEVGQADMLLAKVEGEPVAGLLLFYAGQTAWYLYGASTGQHRKLMPNHLLQWTAMQQAKARGCTLYDMWGAPNIFDETDSMWGVYRFKQGFGGQVVHGLGAWDYPVRPWLYRAFTEGLPRLRELIRN